MKAKQGQGGQRRRWRNLGLAAVILVPLVLALLVGVLVRQLQQDQVGRAEIEASYQLRDRMQEAFALMLDAETGARGFILTGDRRFLEPYESGRASFPEALQALKARSTSPEDQAFLQRLEALASAKLEISARMVGLEAAGHHREAAALVRSGQGKQAMDEVRAVMKDWHTHEELEHAVRSASAAKSAHAVTVAVVALSGMVVVLLILAAGVALTARNEGLAAAAELAESRDQSEAANRAKSAFLAMMSHELRTPLNGVLGMAHVLETTQLGEEQRGFLKVIQDSGRSLLLLLNDILDLSKIEAGKLDIETLVFDVRAELTSTVELWTPPANEKGLQLTLVMADALPAWVAGDPTRLRQVLTNLLSNAVKFTAQGGVAVKAGYENGQIVLTVSDTGVGIPLEAQVRLFSDFEQADSSTSRRFGGTGLGLSISRRLCRLMGGDMVFSSAEGQGTTFTATLDLRAADPPAEGEAGEAEAEMPELRVLAVDDNASNRAVVAALLRSFGLEATLACDGAEALDSLRTSAFDLVLMDVHMPVMDGVEAVRRIRAGGAGRSDIPIIALTADAMAGDREKYLRLGFDHHLGKPISPTALLEALQQVAGAHDADAGDAAAAA